MEPIGRNSLYLALGILFVISHVSTELSVPATSCGLQHDDLGIDFNLRDVWAGGDGIEIPNISINGTQKSMLLGLCRGIKPSLMKCEGKNNSQTSACLYDPVKHGSDYATISKNNSKIVGSISGSKIKHVGDRIHLEYFAAQSTCQSSSSSKITPIGTRVEFFCSPTTSEKPNFLAYKDCTYIFEWPSKNICHIAEKFDSQGVKKTNSTAPPTTNGTVSTNEKKAPSLTDEDLKINLDEKPKTAQEAHKQTLSDASKVIDGAVNKTKIEPAKDGNKEGKKDKVGPIPSTGKADKPASSTAAPSNAKQPDTDQKTAASTASPGPLITKQPDTNHTTTGSTTAQPSARKPDTDPKTAPSTAAPNPQQSDLNKPPRMNKLHKFFMIGLILTSLGAFVVVIFILDRKTRLRIPLSNIRRQVSQAFQPQPVPYTRVDQFNDSLVL